MQNNVCRCRVIVAVQWGVWAVWKDERTLGTDSRTDRGEAHEDDAILLWTPHTDKLKPSHNQDGREVSRVRSRYHVTNTWKWEGLSTCWFALLTVPTGTDPAPASMLDVISFRTLSTSSSAASSKPSDYSENNPIRIYPSISELTSKWISCREILKGSRQPVLWIAMSLVLQGCARWWRAELTSIESMASPTTTSIMPAWH